VKKGFRVQGSGHFNIQYPTLNIQGTKKSQDKRMIGGWAGRAQSGSLGYWIFRVGYWSFSFVYCLSSIVYFRTIREPISLYGAVQALFSLAHLSRYVAEEERLRIWIKRIRLRLATMTRD
jgi:hypothetical protein